MSCFNNVLLQKQVQSTLKRNSFWRSSNFSPLLCTQDIPPQPCPPSKKGVTKWYYALDSLASGFSVLPFQLLYVVFSFMGPSLGCDMCSASKTFPEEWEVTKSRTLPLLLHILMIPSFSRSSMFKIHPPKVRFLAWAMTVLSNNSLTRTKFQMD